MKNYAIPVILVVLHFSCKSPSYHYMTPTLNTATYSHAGEVQASAQFGSAGLAATIAHLSRYKAALSTNRFSGRRHGTIVISVYD